MSNHKRDEKNANSAIVVTVSPEDFENKLFGGMEFQEKLEEKAYKIGNGKIPSQCLGEFMRKKETLDELNQSAEYKVTPIYKGQYQNADIRKILPNFIIEALIEAFENFDKKIKGFANENAILSAIESRTSSPVRIVRNIDGESNIQGIYPSGEGAGYAGRNNVSKYGWHKNS